MKVQDVILKAMAKKISWLDAAEIIGVCDRTMRRMREGYQKSGYDGLRDGRSGKQCSHRVPMDTAEEVLRLYREVYFDLNIRHFHEKLRNEHEIELSYTWVQLALQGAGLVARRRKRGPHRRRRPRRPFQPHGSDTKVRSAEIHVISVLALNRGEESGADESTAAESSNDDETSF